MTYIISGICGSLEKYNALKENAFIKDTDTVYILGGVCGGDLSLLAELSMCANVYPVMSKCDYDSFRMLRGFEKALQSTGDPDPKFITEMKKWIAEGGQEMLGAFRAFDSDMKEGILDYMEEFTLFEEADVKGKEYVLLPMGITPFAKNTDLYDLEAQNFLSKPLDTEKKYFDGKTVVSAETKQKYEKITKVGENISLDCGKAVCLRLEDLSEFYA